MSNVVSPRGPLPPRVYWRRRLLLCAVVVGLVLLVGQLFGGGDDTEPVADRGARASAPTAPAASPTAGPSRGPAAQPSPPPATKRTLNPRQQAQRAAAQARAAELDGPTGPLAPAAGPCEASDVAVVPDVEDTRAYSSVPLRIGLSATGSQACTFDFGSDNVALRVTSGDDLIWETLHCASALPDQSVVVRPGWLSYVDVDWSGRRGSEGCGEGGDFARPGYYWAEASAIGGEPARSQFELRKPPPKPTPEPSSEPTAGDEPVGEPTDEASEPPGAQASPSASPDGTQRPDETTEPSPAAGERKPNARRAGG